MDSISQVKAAEAALIGAVLRDGTVYQQAREAIQPETFGITVHGWAWLAMEHLFEQGMGIDVFTVGDELERMGKMEDFSSGPWSGRAYLADLRSNGDPRNVMTYAENVQDLSVKRGLDAFFTKCVVWSKNGRRAKEILRDVNTELGRITLYDQQDEFTVPLSVAVSEAYDETAQASNGNLPGVTTGLIDMDKIFGSLLPKNVYLVAGRPGSGKTGFLLTIARHAAENKKRVALFSLEMSRTQIAQRLLSQYGGIDLTRIIQGKLLDNEWSLYTNAVEHVADLPIVVNDLSSINIQNIRQTSRKIKETGGLDLVVVDYIQLAEAGEKKQTRELEVSAISRGLKYLARELNVPVLAASQLSREIEKRSEKRPILSDLRESGSLEQDAYAVMFIHRPDQWDTQSTKPNVAEIIVAKHRNGPLGNFDLIFRGPFAKFENAATRIFRLEPEDG